MSFPAPLAIKRALTYGKFKGAGPFKVCVPTTGYHLQHECIAALRDLGHTAIEIPLHNLDCAQALRAILEHLVLNKPDCLLCINHLGFDDGHQLGDLLDACEIPVACWYCDSPFFVLRKGGVPASKMTSLFVWEKGYLPILIDHGAADVHHLPLACDANRFAESGTSGQSPSYVASFVGDSMRGACARWQANLGLAERAWQQKFLHAMQARPRICHARGANLAQKQHPEVAMWDALGAATFVATQAYRDHVLQQLPPADLHVFGDVGWKGVLNPETTLHGPIVYGPQLGQIYKNASININATSLQMPTAVNQRVFDIPLAGGFVISDAQADVYELFDVGTQAAVFNDACELKSLYHHYRRRPQARLEMVKRAQHRIRSCHTFQHRMTYVLSALKQRFS